MNFSDGFSEADGNAPHPTEALIGDLVIDPTLQARIRLDERTVARYAKALRDSGRLPPISVALVDGKPYVYDGFHRIEAHLSIGRTSIMIIAREGTMADAEMWAGCSNHIHGLPLNSRGAKRARELALGGYIRGRRHHRGRRSIKSLAEIARELTESGCAISKSAVRRVLQKNHREVYQRWFAVDDESPRGGCHEIAVDRIENARVALADFQARANALKKSERTEILPEVEAMLAELKAQRRRSAGCLAQRARERAEAGEF